VRRINCCRGLRFHCRWEVLPLRSRQVPGHTSNPANQGGPATRLKRSLVLGDGLFTSSSTTNTASPADLSTILQSRNNKSKTLLRTLDIHLRCLSTPLRIPERTETKGFVSSLLSVQFPRRQLPHNCLHYKPTTGWPLPINLRRCHMGLLALLLSVARNPQCHHRH
jgi:hypothetical protein